MNRLTRLAVACGAGLALALTASPALAAPASDSRSNPAQVEHVGYTFADGSTYELRGTTRFIENGYYTTNTREQTTVLDDGGDRVSFEYKTHYMLSPKVTKMNSQSTTTEGGVTCRTNSQVVATNGELRTLKTRSICS